MTKTTGKLVTTDLLKNSYALMIYKNKNEVGWWIVSNREANNKQI